MNIREVAKKAGTSYTTVSRVLNNSPLVAEKTKEKILRIVDEMGYQINDTARSLATGIRMTVGVMYPYHALRKHESLYTSEVIHSIRKELAELGFDTMITGYDTRTENLESFTRLIRQKKVDGLIIIGSEISREAVEAVSLLTDRIFLINPERADWSEGFSKVLVDDFSGGALASGEFLSRGKTRPLVIMQEAPIFDLRYRGFNGYWKEKTGTEAERDVLPDGSYSTAYEYAFSEWTHLCEFDALFVLADEIAFAVMNALQDRGVRIPEDLGVIGYDDVEWSQYCRPSLTTIHQPRSQVAVLAAEYMKNRILDKEENRSASLLNPELIVRDSC